MARTLASVKLTSSAARRGLLAAALVAVAAGCGTTVPAAVQNGTAGTTTGGSGNGLAAPPTGPSAASGGLTPSGATGTGATGTANSVTGGPTNPTGSATVAPSPGAIPTTGPASASAPGVTATSIDLGLIYENNAGAVNAAIGAGNLNPGNEQQDWSVLVKYINAHGGIAGRHVNPIYFSWNPDSNETVDEAWQAACNDFTQDHHVFAALNQADASFARCMLSHGAAIVGENFTIDDSSFFANYPYYVEPGGIAIDRIVRTEVPQMVQEGYFGRNPKIGILTYDDPVFARAVHNVFVPELAQYGYHNVLVEQAGSPVEAFSSTGQLSASVQNAELKFRENGVDHVLFLEEGGALALFFMEDANSQHWTPRYGVNSQDAVEALVAGGDVPASQIVGAAGVGWIPVTDIATWSDTGPYANSTDRTCDALMRAGGVSVTGPDSEGILYLDCDQMFFLRQALDATGGNITRGSFLSAANATGAGFADALTPIGTYFSANQHDGVAKVYDWLYQSGCGCMNYVGTPINIG